MDDPSLKPPEQLFAQAYQSLLPELLALPDAEVIPINIGVAGAVSKALGIEPTLARLQHRIAKAAPEVDPRLPERLTTHALALSHAHTLFVTALQGVDALPSLATEAKELRGVLLADAQALIRRALVDGAALGALRIDKGYLNLAADLLLLTKFFRGCSASTMGLTAIRATEIQRAEELAATILTLFGRRKKLRASIEAASDLRNRAFTLFARVYEEARRVVVFLRWYERDADRLVPLLYAKRKERKRKPPLSGDKLVRLDTRGEAELGDQRL